MIGDGHRRLFANDQINCLEWYREEMVFIIFIFFLSDRQRREDGKGLVF